jgi:hypothetical protein
LTAGTTVRNRDNAANPPISVLPWRTPAAAVAASPADGGLPRQQREPHRTTNIPLLGAQKPTSLKTNASNFANKPPPMKLRVA